LGKDNEKVQGARLKEQGEGTRSSLRAERSNKEQENPNPELSGGRRPGRKYLLIKFSLSVGRMIIDQQKTIASFGKGIIPTEASPPPWAGDLGGGLNAR